MANSVLTESALGGVRERAQAGATRPMPAVLQWVLRVPLALKIVGTGVLVAGGAAITVLASHAANSSPGTTVLIAALSLAGVVGISAVLVRIALRPLRDLEVLASRILAGDLNARIAPSPLADREMLSVGAAVNSVLDSLAEERARIRELASQIIRTADAERTLIGRELHDRVAQRAAALMFQLSAFARDVASPEDAARLRELRTECAGVLEELRTLAQAAHPRILEDLGLVAALKQIARQAMDHSSVTVDVMYDGDVADEYETAGVLYRVAQESVRNALLHAGASRIVIRVSRSANRIELEVSDDGGGFDVADAERRRPGMGLFTMRERLKLVGGDLLLLSSSGNGTRVVATVPSPGRINDGRS